MVKNKKQNKNKLAAVVARNLIYVFGFFPGITG